MKKYLSSITPKLYGMFLNIYVLISPNRTAHKGFHIFCTVRQGKVLPTQKEFLDAVKYKQYAIAGHTIQTYHWAGKKETVLLVHGWESNSWRWHKLIEKLTSEDYNIIAFDAPAHGYSTGKYLYVPLYAQVLEYLILEHQPKFLVGHSVGGMTILYNEYLNPSPVATKMVTIGSPSEFHEIMSHFQNLLGFNDRVLSALDNYIKGRFDFNIREFSSSRYVKKNTKKGLLFHDTLDKIAPYHASEQVHASWKGSELISTKGLGHSMHQDEVNEKIVEFLNA